MFCCYFISSMLVCSSLCKLSSSGWYLQGFITVQLMQATSPSCVQDLPVLSQIHSDHHFLPPLPLAAWEYLKSTARLSQHWATSNCLHWSKSALRVVKVNSHVGKHLYLASVTLPHNHLVASFWQVDSATWIFTTDAWRGSKNTLSLKRLGPACRVRGA